MQPFSRICPSLDCAYAFRGKIRPGTKTDRWTWRDRKPGEGRNEVWGRQRAEEKSAIRLLERRWKQKFSQLEMTRQIQPSQPSRCSKPKSSRCRCCSCCHHCCSPEKVCHHYRDPVARPLYVRRGISTLLHTHMAYHTARCTGLLWKENGFHWSHCLSPYVDWQ